MVRLRYALLAVREDGAVTDLARFRTRDLADALLDGIKDKYSGFSFTVDDIYGEKATADILADDDEFD